MHHSVLNLIRPVGTVPGASRVDRCPVPPSVIQPKERSPPASSQTKEVPKASATPARVHTSTCMRISLTFVHLICPVFHAPDAQRAGQRHWWGSLAPKQVLLLLSTCNSASQGGSKGNDSNTNSCTNMAVDIMHSALKRGSAGASESGCCGKKGRRSYTPVYVAVQ